MNKRHTFFATCAPGLERFLLAEARQQKLGKPEGQPGGVQFTGTIRDAWRANLYFRTASRVLLRLARFPAEDAAALYAGASEVPWEEHLRPSGTLAVQARSRASNLDHTMFISQKVKDAVVDRFRERHGKRPSVDPEDPDLKIQVHLARDRCTLLLDTSGEALHRRGWRKFSGAASLKETVAAACVMGSGWDGRSPLLDPFCGSGTILVEAALIAGGIPPGRFRERWGFQSWPGHDEKRFRAYRAEADGLAPPKKLILMGWDADPEVVAGARENLESAGLADRISVEAGSAKDFAPKKGWNAWVVTNPPYGERVGRAKELEGVYRRFGESLRERCGGYRAAVLCGNPDLAKKLQFTAAESIPLMNGPIECRLTVFDVRRRAAKD